MTISSSRPSAPSVCRRVDRHSDRAAVEAACSCLLVAPVPRLLAGVELLADRLLVAGDGLVDLCAARDAQSASRQGRDVDLEGGAVFGAQGLLLHISGS